MITRVDLSETESSVLGLKVGRCNTDILDQHTLARLITDESYDLCRLKIPAEEEMASLKLQETGLPFFFSGSIRRYKTRVDSYPPGDFLHPTMLYEMYDGSQDELLLDMLRGTWGTYPLGYYRTPYLCHLVDKEVEIQSVFRFYRKFNLNRDYPQNSILFMREGEHYVGFFALNIVNGNLESHIGGILEPYRRGGYFLDMLRYIRRFCVDHTLPHFLFGARNENAEVQRIFHEQGFVPTGTENVFHIASLLSHSVKGHVEYRLTDHADIFHRLSDALAEGLPLAGQSYSTHFQATPRLREMVSGCKLKVHFPVQTTGEALAVGKVYGEDGRVLGIAYLGLSATAAL